MAKKKDWKDKSPADVNRWVTTASSMTNVKRAAGLEAVLAEVNAEEKKKKKKKKGE